MQTNAILVSLILAACSGAPRAVAQEPAPRAAEPHVVAVAELVGVWSGKAVGTPFGDFPFAIAFDREPGDRVHGRLDGGDGMYLDFVFHRDGERWLLTEEGAIPSVGVQKHTLAPRPGEARWTDGEARLEVELAVTAETLVMTTTLAGKRHAVFELNRARGEAAEQIRQAIARGPRSARAK